MRNFEDGRVGEMEPILSNESLLAYQFDNEFQPMIFLQLYYIDNCKNLDQMDDLGYYIWSM